MKQSTCEYFQRENELRGVWLSPSEAASSCPVAQASRDGTALGSTE